MRGGGGSGGGGAVEREEKESGEREDEGEGEGEREEASFWTGCHGRFAWRVQVRDRVEEEEESDIV